MARLRTPSRIALAASLLIVTCCQTPQPAPPAPAPAPAPALVLKPAPAPVPIAPEANWIDRPQTPGNWQYGDQTEGGMAVFSSPSGAGLFMLECNRVEQWIELYRSGNSGGERAAVIRTETGSRALRMEPKGSGYSVSLNPRDPLLDAMAITRGRFAVEVEGETPLYLPAWAEVTRVIEDCR